MTPAKHASAVATATPHNLSLRAHLLNGVGLLIVERNCDGTT